MQSLDIYSLEIQNVDTYYDSRDYDHNVYTQGGEYYVFKDSYTQNT